jgi:hypothetical protein
MSMQRFAVLLSLVAASGCGDDMVAPPESTGLEGRYALAWVARADAPTVTIVPGVPIPIAACPQGAPVAASVVTLADSSALTIQQSPQSYALSISGSVTDCTGARQSFLDVAVGEYVAVDDTWITLMGDAVHPNAEGRVTRGASDSVTIVLRPALPGLAAPLVDIERLCFASP